MTIVPRVVVASDDAVLLERAHRLLADALVNVATTTIAECPLEVLFAEGPCAAIVVDKRAPDAAALVAQLRRDPRSASVPILRAPRTLTAASEGTVYSKLVGALFVEAVLTACAAPTARAPAAQVMDA